MKMFLVDEKGVVREVASISIKLGAVQKGRGTRQLADPDRHEIGREFGKLGGQATSQKLGPEGMRDLANKRWSKYRKNKSAK